MDILSKIRNIPDFPKPGIQFKDITTLLADPEGFNAVIFNLAKRYHDAGLTKIVGVESRGFIFGAALAHALGLGFVPVRKEGKLPHETLGKSYELEYGSATIEIHKDALTPDDRVVIIDDLMATGGTLEATVHLVEQLGAEIAEVWVLMELSFLNGKGKLGGVPYHAEISIGEE
ncbi:MAG: adenine phosphoribosyltransferase [Sumerlaeia bacterium]